ncbi:hypothetical protein UFOVP1037_17 [uncultured Caudovirales phage]|uniref:Uncharacterized protein n=1 Tax=uncultured Caudovirales phage TaxID=2100421 RepID=A0A6J5LLN4_9CAUD|nr:hypothetical protein UFOVP287_22 [uncultured Caudovirales phage]CAB4174182.1 hypothetical protein UFOVP969_30 [uncultured Caudovirales phage]CAB4180364.1 hypothetical protein UFOVP1037_17 [uncultured Caudovirales phage]CAB4194001.1 hypothetical protein UFOVP1250_19 [uncultured Caudovirales phage]
MADYSDRLGDYIDVAERIRLFRDKHPEGSLQPANLEKPFDMVTLGDKTFVVYISAAYRTPDDIRPGIGAAWEPFPGRTPYTKDSELMVAETSSWGRAIMAVLAADSKRVASLDEVRARKTQAEHPATMPARASQSVPSVVSSQGHPLATQAQIGAIKAISRALGKPSPAGLDEISKGTAHILIEQLKAEQAQEQE